MVFGRRISDGSDSCLSTLGELLAWLVDPGEQYGLDEPLLKVEDFKKIFEILSKDQARELLDCNFATFTATNLRLLSLVLQHTAYFILDEPEVMALAKLVKKNLHIDKLTKSESMRQVTYCMSLYLCLYKHFESDYDAELQELAVQWTINNFSEMLAENEALDDQAEKSFHLNVLLDFLTKMMDKFGMLQFTKMTVNLPEDTLMLHKQEELRAKREARQQKEQLRKQALDKAEEEAKAGQEQEQEELEEAES